MTSKQIGINNIAKALIVFFDMNETPWKGRPPMEVCINNIKAYHSGVEMASYLQVYKITKGLTSDKKQNRKLMIDIALGVISKIRPYAIRSNNHELLLAIDYAKSDLDHGKEELCVNRCKTIAARGREYLSFLGMYNLTENDLIALETAVDPFIEIAEKRDITEGERIAATEKIVKLISAMRKEYRILDDLVRSQIADKDFIATYFKLR